MSYFLPSEKKEINFPALIIGLFKYERLHKPHSQSTPCGVSCHGSETAKGHKYVSESQTVKFLVRRSYFLHHATNRTHYNTSQFVRLSISLNMQGNGKCFRQFLYILFKVTFHISTTISNRYAFFCAFRQFLYILFNPQATNVIYIYMEHPFLMFLDHTQRRSTVGRTPLDE